MIKTAEEAWYELACNAPIEQWFKDLYEGNLYPWWMIGGATEEDGEMLAKDYLKASTINQVFV